MLKSRTYTEQVLRWKLIPPCSPLFFVMAFGADMHLMLVLQGFPARAARPGFSTPLIMPLLAGEA
jgi:hypothetical protein